MLTLTQISSLCVLIVHCKIVPLPMADENCRTQVFLCFGSHIQIFFHYIDLIPVATAISSSLSPLASMYSSYLPTQESC